MEGRWSKVQIKIIRKVSTRDTMYNMRTIANHAVGCLRKVLRKSVLRVLITRKLVFLFISLYLYEMIYLTQSCCDTHFTLCVNQTITLYTLNLHGGVCHFSTTTKRLHNHGS